jgi:transcriptional regulator with XRE-family HTH domain
MPQLPNYLLSNRKRLALSQEDVAFLLGTRGSSQISRYERFARNPSLETALAYEAILQTPARELFGGIYRRVQKQVAARAKTLTHRIERKQSTRRRHRRRESLASIINQSVNNHEEKPTI